MYLHLNLKSSLRAVTPKSSLQLCALLIFCCLLKSVGSSFKLSPHITSPSQITSPNQQSVKPQPENDDVWHKCMLMYKSAQTLALTLKMQTESSFPELFVHTDSEKHTISKTNCLRHCSGQLPGGNQFSCVNTKPSTAEKLCARRADHCHINQDKKKHKQNINKAKTLGAY